MNLNDFKAALSQFASGVTIVTASAPNDGPPAGFTASAFTSVSLDPPLVLVCLARSAQSHEAFLSAANIGISILADGQRDIAMRFADSSASKFVDGTSIADYHSVPVVDGANAQLLCRVEDRIVKGDHTIIVAEVEDVSLAADAPPLLYWDRNFRQLAGS